MIMEFFIISIVVLIFGLIVYVFFYASVRGYRAKQRKKATGARTQAQAQRQAEVRLSAESMEQLPQYTTESQPFYQQPPPYAA